MTAESPDEPRLCIAIPYYSNLGYLEAALRSLIGQSDPHWTAIIVDDAGPQRGAAEVVATLGDHRIRYELNSRNLGVAGNFNRCLELGAAVADIVTVFHADDVLEPGYVAAIRAAHRAFPDAACAAPQVTVIDADGEPTRTLGDTVKRLLWPRTLPRSLEGDRGLARVMHGLFFYCPSVSYRVDALPAVRFDSRWQQVMDLDLFARMLLGGGSIVLVAQRVYRYRRHTETMTSQNSRSLVRLEEEVAVSREVAAAARQLGWRRSSRSARLRVTVRLNGLLEVGRLIIGRRPRAALKALRYSLRP